MKERNMKLEKRFTEADLSKIVEEATIYMCACPAQVAEQIRKLRNLVRYQEECDSQMDTDSVVHKTIAKAGLQALKIMEDCMDEVLTLEGWDRTTLTMPEGLRKRRDEIVNIG